MDWLGEHGDALLTALVSVLGATAAFLMRERKSRGGLLLSRSQAHQAHAKAEATELAARSQLDDAARAWAEKLIARYDAEVEELRGEIHAARQEWRVERRALEEKHAQARQAWECEMRRLQEAHAQEIAQLRARIVEQQKEITALRLLLERRGFKVGTGPLDVGALDLVVRPDEKEGA